MVRLGLSNGLPATGGEGSMWSQYARSQCRKGPEWTFQHFPITKVSAHPLLWPKYQLNTSRWKYHFTFCLFRLQILDVKTTVLFLARWEERKIN